MVDALHRGPPSSKSPLRGTADEFPASPSSVVVMPENTDFPKGMGAPATRALIAAGYTSIDELAGVPAAELAVLHGVGPKALKVIEETLAQRGTALGRSERS